MPGSSLIIKFGKCAYSKSIYLVVEKKNSLIAIDIDMSAVFMYKPFIGNTVNHYFYCAFQYHTTFELLFLRGSLHD